MTESPDRPVFTRDKDWPPSEFVGKKAVLLYENGSIIYTWFDTDIDEVLKSPTPPELMLRFAEEQVDFYPEIGEHFIDALDHQGFEKESRLIEVVVTEKEFNLVQAIVTEIDPEIDKESEKSE